MVNILHTTSGDVIGIVKTKSVVCLEKQADEQEQKKLVISNKIYFRLADNI